MTDEDMLNHEQLLKLIRDKVEHPATPRELLQRLKIPRDERPTLKRLLKDLVAAGELVETRGNRYGLPDRMNLIVGRITTHPRGFGFVVPDRPVEGVTGDIYVAGSNLNQAMHGDRVVARVERVHRATAPKDASSASSNAASATIVGRFEADGAGAGFVVPFDRRLIMDVQIPPGEQGDAQPSDMVVGRDHALADGRARPGRPRRSRCSATSTSRASTPRSSSASTAFPTSTATRRSRRPGGSAARSASADLAGRTDFRPMVTVTIDGEHARDFDDAITIERLANGNYWLGVHIADVAHYVPEGSALDEEAYERATSVYFPERAVHMFPSELSTGLCSLNPHVDRLVQSCLMEIDRKGAVVRYEIHDGVIHSNARMTYTDVNAILTDHDAAVIARYRELVPQFELMQRAVRDPEPAAAPPRLDRFRPQGAGDRARRSRAWSKRSSPPSATSRTG